MYEFIRTLAGRLSCQSSVSRSQAVFDQAMAKGNFRWGRKAKLLAGASLAIALREANKSDSLRDIAVSSPKSLSRNPPRPLPFPYASYRLCADFCSAFSFLVSSRRVARLVIEDLHHDDRPITAQTRFGRSRTAYTHSPSPSTVYHQGTVLCSASVAFSPISVGTLNACYTVDSDFSLPRRIARSVVGVPPHCFHSMRNPNAVSRRGSSFVASSGGLSGPSSRSAGWSKQSDCYATVQDRL